MRIVPAILIQYTSKLRFKKRTRKIFVKTDDYKVENIDRGKNGCTEKS